MAEPQLTPEVFDRAIVAIALTAGPEHVLVYRNDAFLALFGPRPTGRPMRELFTEPGVNRFLESLDVVLAGGTARQVTTPRTVETSHEDPEGHRHFVYSCSPVSSRFGPGVLVSAIDTTAEVHSAHQAEQLSTERLHALQRYEALMSAVSQLVWLTRADGSMVELVPGWEELTGHPWRDTMDEEWFELIHPQDRDALARSWLEAAEGEPSMFEHSFRVRTAGGEYRHIAARAVPIVRDGRLVEWIGATSDIEDRWRNRLRERLLARAVAVTEATRAEDAFAAVAELVVPDLTDACTVFLLSGREHSSQPDEIRGIRIASIARPGLPPLPALRQQTFVLGPAARRVVADRTPVVLTFTPDRVPPGLVPAESSRWLARAGATSLTLLPIVIDGATVALAAAAGCDGTPPPGRAAIELLQEVLQRAQAPLRQTLELQRTRHAALVLQRALLTAPPAVPGAELAARYQPGNRAAEVGGDWYDAFVLPDDSLALTIGDVAGHDLTAATTMGQLRSMLRSIAYNRTHLHTPAYALAELDAAADGLGVAAFATAIHLHLARTGDGGWQAAWSNAGHPPPLLVPADGPARFLTADEADLPLCVAPAEARHTHESVIGPGDTLLLYTDGLVEVPGENLAAGLERLADAADAGHGLPLGALCDQLLAEVPDARDDIALIAFRAGSPTSPSVPGPPQPG
ncbi:SpoIIE family protein phosphatase [Kitasatospora sp. NPDC052868]|uniref:SpoIIE family protein phosphatase n=1 Tax=Kitasatospora sp. NPDC052868 TaxID=3364060 RepID=UPI0037CB7C06